MTKLVKKIPKKLTGNVKYVYNFDDLRALETRQTPVSHLPMPVQGSDDIGNVGQTLTGTGLVAVRLGPVDKSTKKSPMAGRYEGLSDRHRPICVGFDSDGTPDYQVIGRLYLRAKFFRCPH